jgi:hypothetical protein
LNPATGGPASATPAAIAMSNFRLGGNTDLTQLTGQIARVP